MFSPSVLKHFHYIFFLNFHVCQVDHLLVCVEKFLVFTIFLCFSQQGEAASPMRGTDLKKNNLSNG